MQPEKRLERKQGTYRKGERERERVSEEREDERNG